MTHEMRALGLGLFVVVPGVVVACGSTTHEHESNAAGCAGIGAISGANATTVAGTNANGGTSTTGGSASGGTAGSTSPAIPQGGNAGDAGEIAAAGAGGEGGAVDTGKTAISGVVVGADELPVAGAVVQAQGHHVTTGADGRFRLSVDLPYDLVLFEPKLSAADEPDIAEPHAYLGLTRSELKLSVRTQLNRTTLIFGTVIGRLATPEPMLSLVYGHATQNWFDYTVNGVGSFSFEAPPWHGDAPLPALLIATQADPPQNPDDDVLHLNSFAIKAVNLTTAAIVQVEVPLAKPQLRQLAFEWHQPPGQSFDDCDVTVQLAGAIGLFFQYGCQPVSRNIDIPDGLPDGVLRVSAHGFSSLYNWEYEVTATIPGDAKSFSVNVPQNLPSILSPASQASLKTSSGAIAYSLGDGAKALAVLKLCFPDWKAKRVACANVYTSETTIPLARLLALGMHTAASGTLSLEVQAIPDLQTADDVVAPNHFDADGTWLYRNYVSGTVRDFFYTAD